MRMLPSLIRLLLALAILRSGGQTAETAQVPAETSEPEQEPQGKRAPRMALAAAVAVLATLVMLPGMYACVKLGAETAPPVVLVTGSGSQDWSQVYENVNPAIGQIGAKDGSSGTGFLISPSTVATAAHVVLQMENEKNPGKKRTGLRIRFSDGRERQARIIGADARADVALLKLDSPLDNATPLEFADLRQARIGEPVAALGYPFGESEMLTTGIISGYASNSSFASDEAAQNWMVQSDVAVNPGNSGGPLLDSSGHVLGIIVLRPDDMGDRTVEGVSLAVPSAMAAAVINAMEHGEKMSYARLGIAVSSATVDDAAHPGVLVSEIVTGGPADGSGLEEGDVIVALSGAALTGTDDLYRELTGYAEGDTVDLTVVGKNGKKRHVQIVAGKR